MITATEEGGAIAVEAQKRPDASAEECAAPEAMPPAVAEVLAVLRSASFEVVGAPIDADAPLIEAGLDSATLGEFQGLVSERLSSSRLSSGRFSSGAPLPETLVFEHPTLRQLAAAIGGDDRSSQQINGDSSMPVARDASTVSARACGLSAVLPGRLLGVGSLAHMSSCGGDLITEVPPDRWPVGGPGFSDGVIGQRARHGGFISNTELFGNAFFGVSPAEAGAMDPQQRLLLEHGYASLHAASLEKRSLLGSLTGVFLGIAADDYAEVVRTTRRL